LDTLTIADWGSFCTPKGCGKRKEEPCVNKLLIEFQKFYELFRINYISSNCLKIAVKKAGVLGSCFIIY
ncbi:hypothetical protein ACWOEA_07145, partial [Enterococcus malodoratus]